LAGFEKRVLFELATLKSSVDELKRLLSRSAAPAAYCDTPEIVPQLAAGPLDSVDEMHMSRFHSKEDQACAVSCLLMLCIVLLFLWQVHLFCTAFVDPTKGYHFLILKVKVDLYSAPFHVGTMSTTVTQSAQVRFVCIWDHTVLPATHTRLSSRNAGPYLGIYLRNIQPAVTH